jgi:probable rRNA maturation factor
VSTTSQPEEEPDPPGFTHAPKSFDTNSVDTNGSDLKIEVTIDASVSSPVDVSLLERAAKTAAASRGFLLGQLGIRITDDSTIQTINAKHLGHDYATDVISFGYVAEDSVIEGELVASVDTARTRAAELGWSTDKELTLYIVHGVLHITGLDDHADADRLEMRRMETKIMTSLGIPEITRYGADRDE